MYNLASYLASHQYTNYSANITFLKEELPIHFTTCLCHFISACAMHGRTSRVDPLCNFAASLLHGVPRQWSTAPDFRVLALCMRTAPVDLPIPMSTERAL